MKIIEWNCQGAFRKKNEQILKQNPDILIVLECENEERLQFGKLTPRPNDFFWYGDIPNKGIAVFAYSDYKFELLKEFNPKFKYIIPLKVTRENESFLLFAIWAKDDKQNPLASYIGQIWLAVNYYSRLFDYNSILIGDFNSNQIWDNIDRIGNHTHVVDKLKEKGIYSLYHEKLKVEQGQEKDYTFFMHRRTNRPYHIDYCFMSKHFLVKDYSFTLGNYGDWVTYSDHVPMTVELDYIPKLIKVQNSLKDSLEYKFENLADFTKEKFHQIIKQLVLEAKESDELDFSETNYNQRKEIIQNAQKLIEIDKLVNGIKYIC